MMNRKQVLILSYFANEDGMACSHHIDDRLPLFRDMGCEPAVLSSICMPKLTGYAHFRACSLMPAGIRFEVRRFLRRRGEESIPWKLRSAILFPLLPFYGLDRLVFRVDGTRSWLPHALVQGIRICRTRGIDLLYSTGGPPVVHEVARRIKRRLSLKWLAEVQDPLVHGYCAARTSEVEYLRKLEKMIYEQADRMIFLTRGAMARAEERIGRTGKGVVIYPGAEQSAIREQPEPSRQFRIAHFGSLGGVRNLRTLIRGMEMAAGERGEGASCLQVDLYGGVGDDDRQRIALSPCRPVFRFKGAVRRQTAVALMQSYDMLLLIQGVHDISRETIPSKLYEYLHSGCPVLGLVYRNPELEAMLTGLGHVAVGADDPEEVAATLRRLVRDRQAGRLPQPLASPFTTRRAVRELLAL